MNDYQKKMAFRLAVQVLSWISIAIVILPSFLFLAGKMDLPSVKTWMLVGTIAWFVFTPLWMGHEKPQPSES